MWYNSGNEDAEVEEAGCSFDRAFVGFDVADFESEELRGDFY